MTAPSLTRSRLERLLEAMQGRRVVVVGDAMLDRYLVGDTERISPEAPVPVVRIVERREAPGGAANVAMNLAALGAHAELFGVTGDDLEGAALRRTLGLHGLASKGLIVLAERRTTTKTRVVARGQQVVRIDEENDAELDAEPVARLLALVEDALTRADALVFEDYNKGVLVPALIRPALEAARARGLPVVVDPKHRSFFAYAGATVFKPNRRELVDAIPGLDLEQPAMLAHAAERLAVGHLLVTLGAEGMLLVAQGGAAEPHLIPARPHAVFDVSGAGDTVTAWVAAALAAGATPVEAAEIANLAAGIEVTKPGVATVTPAEVRAAGAFLAP